MKVWFPVLSSFPPFYTAKALLSCLGSAPTTVQMSLLTAMDGDHDNPHGYIQGPLLSGAYLSG